MKRDCPNPKVVRAGITAEEIRSIIQEEISKSTPKEESKKEESPF
jgi:hypothetical protein